MKVLKLIGIVTAGIVAICVILLESLILTVFSDTDEFWISAQASSAAVLILVTGYCLRSKLRWPFTIGSALLFCVLASVALLSHFGLHDTGYYYCGMDISLPSWHYDMFAYFTYLFTLVLALVVANKVRQQIRCAD